MQRRNFIPTLLGIISGTWITTSQAPAKVTQPHTPKKISSSRSVVLPYIAEWLRIPQQPLLELSEVPTTDRETASVLFHHIHKGTRISITYHGGTEPNTKRSITPVLLFQKIANPYALVNYPTPFDPSMIEVPPTYLLAYCHLRKATRTFRLDRIEI